MEKKGIAPPIKQDACMLRYQGCLPICFGIRLYSTGLDIIFLLNPMKDPRKTRGIETPNHSAIRVSITEKDT